MADKEKTGSGSNVYHIYPLGLPEHLFVTKGKQRQGGRILEVLDWIEHFKSLGSMQSILDRSLNLFPHGYDRRIIVRQTADWERKKDFQKVFTALHENGIRVIVDGVFNHVGRKFFAFWMCRRIWNSQTIKTGSVI